jgi:hypothetical protein
MTTAEVILAIATFAGPVVAVLVTIWLQGKIEARATSERQGFQRELLELQTKYHTQARDGWQKTFDDWLHRIENIWLGKGPRGPLPPTP